MRIRIDPKVALVAFAAAAAYFALARLGLHLASVSPSASPVWPATGFAVAAVSLWGRGALIGVAIGAFFANLISAAPASSAPGIMAGNALEAWVGAWLLS